MPTPHRFSKSPKALGYTFPAEWARQSATWFSWPRPEGISFPGKYHTVPANLAAIIREIAPRQTVHINVPNANWQRIVTEQLLAGGVASKFLPKLPASEEAKPDRRSRVQFHFIKTNESWCRDHGPAFVVKANAPKSKRLAIVDWGFNAWGGKYPPYDSDDHVPTRIAEEMHATSAGLFEPTHPKAGGEQVAGGRRVVMEGGAVEFNGLGTVLTTESCLLNKNRNPGLSRAQVEHFLCEYYGQRHVCWLGDGIVGDDTDGHIDDLARFIDPHTIVIAREPNRRDENYRILEENAARTHGLRDQDGRPFRVVEVPMPGVVEHDGQRLPATYLNFLFVNGALLVPTFRHRKHDAAALTILQEHLPRHKVIGIDCTELIWGLGAIHCLTQQQPAV